MLRYLIGISVLTLGIIVIRALSDGKILHKYQYAFWIVIPLYMILVPFIKIDVPIEAIWNSIFIAKTDSVVYEASESESPKVITEDLQTEYEVHENKYAVNYEQQEIPEAIYKTGQISGNQPVVSNVKTIGSKDIETKLFIVSSFVSAILIVALITYNAGFILSCIHNRKYVGKDSSSGLKIYRIRHKETPFLLLNKIYVDYNPENINKYEICHEVCHYKHGDYLWVLIRYLVLLLNWYNPFIWSAFILSGRDCELACDEEVVRVCGADSSKDYARTLVGILQQTEPAVSLTVSTGMRGGYEMMKKRVISIKKPVHNNRKALALSLAAIILFTSCSFVNTAKNARKITVDDPWFNVNVFDVDTGVDKNRNVKERYEIDRFVGMDDKYYVINTGGTYEITEEESEKADFDFNAYTFSVIGVIDRATNQTVNSFDPKNDFSNSDYTIDAIYYSDGKITVKTNSAERDYDPLTGQLLDCRVGSSNKDDRFSKKYIIGEYTVETEMFQTETNHRYCNIKIVSPDGKVSELELKKDAISIYVFSVLAISDAQALLPATIGKEKGYYELDLTTNELKEADPRKYDWMNEASFYNIVSGSDGMVYYKTSYGVSRINARKKVLEEVFNYSWCSFNSGIMDRCELIECQEDRFVLFGVCDTSGAYAEKKADKANFIEITRADKNPHAGKTVIELFSTDGMCDRKVSEAILTFNETNGKYFIEVTSRYNVNDYYDMYGYDNNNEDVWYKTKLVGSKGISNKLAMDIMSGEGPDILMNTGGSIQLNSLLDNSNYLADLTPYVKGLDSEKYFTNIIEGSKTEGKLYQLPVSFILEGILTKTGNAGSSGKGFTYEEYIKFVDEVMNGKDPIVYGQPTYFAMLFSSMSDEFISKGKVDLSGEKFKALAEFVRDNVREEGISEYDWYLSTQSDGPTPKSWFESCSGINDYFRQSMGIATYGKGVTMQGIPSYDGRGPRFKPACSVAVSVQAVDIKACGEFVKILLSEDIQKLYALNDNFVVSREAYRLSESACLDYYKRTGKEYTVQDIDFVESVILSCSKIKSEDSDISIILIEEMPAYFLGQKDLDAVIKIAQNRIQKVLDERG